MTATPQARFDHAAALLLLGLVGLACLSPVSVVLPVVWRFVEWSEGSATGNYLPVDKLLHAVAFCLLAWILWRSFRHLSTAWRGLCFAAVAALGYGAVIEGVQPLFGRTADPLDFVADALGVAVVFVVGMKTFAQR